MKIEEFLNVGKENCLTRAKLVERTGCNDRDIRVLISDAFIQRKVPIVNLGKGYYIADLKTTEGAHELALYLAQEKSRRNKIDLRLSVGYAMLFFRPVRRKEKR